MNTTILYWKRNLIF